MENKMDEIVDKLMETVGNLAASLGLNKVAGQLYVLLFLNSNPLSLDEMTQKLKISKGHVSTNIRALERWQAVQKVWIKGSRKDFYKANPNTLKIIINQLRQGVMQRLEELAKAVELAKSKVECLSDSRTKKKNMQLLNLENKLNKIEQMHKNINDLLMKLNLLSQF